MEIIKELIARAFTGPDIGNQHVEIEFPDLALDLRRLHDPLRTADPHFAEIFGKPVDDPQPTGFIDQDFESEFLVVLDPDPAPAIIFPANRIEVDRGGGDPV